MKRTDFEHPDYTTEPFEASLERERTLHRVVAVSAFVTALCVLPIAQFFLLGAEGTTRQEVGQVAGASTEAPTTSETLNAIALPDADATPKAQTLVECVNQKETDRADLERFLEGKKRAMLRDYEVAIAGYTQALESLSANAPASERQSLNTLIDNEYQAYLKNLSAVEKAVTESNDQITARECPVN